MPLHVTYKGRIVASRRNTAEGLLLKLKSDKPGQPADYVTVSEADWQQYGQQVYLDEKPVRRAAKS